MTDGPIQLLHLSSRTATLTIEADAHLFALDRALPCVVQLGDGTTVKTGSATSVVLSLDGLEPDSEYRFSTAVGGITFRTADETALVDIRDHGARSDSKDNTKAIQSAIAAVPAGGTLRLPAGSWT
ncbi:MAG: glycoside hydrolase family 28 protein, partial [Allorhizobium sp.]